MQKSVLTALAVVVPLLSGCSLLGLDAETERNEMVKARLEQMTEEFKSCGARHGPTRVDSALCVNAAFQSAMADVDCPYPDLVATLSSERLRAAELVDKGQISSTEALARVTDKIADVISLERARHSNFGKKSETLPPEYFLQLMQVGI